MWNLHSFIYNNPDSSRSEFVQTNSHTCCIFKVYTKQYFHETISKLGQVLDYKIN